MTSIYSYQKYIDAIVSITLLAPSDLDGVQITELCTIDDTTYVSVPAGIILPDQPEPIAASVQLITLTPELREAIKVASPHCALIAVRMEEQIRAVYSLSDEQYFARIGVGAALGSYTFEPGEMDELLAFGAFVEATREWGRTERALLGL